jgi:ABC-type transporter Mla subunit MlaD
VTIGVLAGALVLTSGALEGRYDLYLRTEEAEGLTQDTRVVLQGLSIGRVSQINPHLDPLTNTLRFVATLSVRERFPDGTRLQLPAGTEAWIAPPPTVVGPSQIELVMPPASPDAEFLQEGDTLDAERRESIVDALGEIAVEVRGELESMLQNTRDLLAQTTSTVEATQVLLNEARPRVRQVLARVDTSLQRTEQILAQVEPRVGPVTDSVMATLASSNALLIELDSLATLGQTIALENRDELGDAIEKLSQAAVILQHFADQISRRPLRFLTGVTPPLDSTVPPDTSRNQ